MSFPGLVMSFVMASACGLGFHLIWGGRLGRLLLYLATSWISFLVGHFVGEWLDWHFIRVGSLNLFPAFLASGLGLISARFLAGPEAKPPRRTPRRRTNRDRER